MKFESFEHFWPFYLEQHSHPRTRLMHVTGTSLALIAFGWGCVTRQYAWIGMAFVFGYGFAWLAHLLVEKNRPATFKNPIYSLMADFKMWAYYFSGQLDEELKSWGINSPSQISSHSNHKE